MKLLFNLEYRTNFGEQLVLNLLGEEGKTIQYPMSTLDGLNWTVEIQKDPSTLHPSPSPITLHPSPFTYYYCVVRGDKELRHEWLVEPHRLELAAEKAVSYTVFDRWIDIPEDSYMYSSAFTDCIFRREDASSLNAQPSTLNSQPSSLISLIIFLCQHRLQIDLVRILVRTVYIAEVHATIHQHLIRWRTS